MLNLPTLMSALVLGSSVLQPTAPSLQQEPTDKPHFTPYTVKPELLNRSQVASELVRNYPPALRDSGRGGQVDLWLFVDSAGRTVKSLVRTSSGSAELDTAAVVVGRMMLWSPAKNRDQLVPVWIAVPVNFKVPAGGAPTPSVQGDPRAAFSFSTADKAGRPGNWHFAPAETVSLDSVNALSAPFSARLERTPKSTSTFSVLTYTIPVTFSGQTLELRGSLRTRDVSEFAGLWLREDASTSTVQFDNMQQRHISGSTEWTSYSIRLPLDPRARTIFMGALVAGTGTAWADDLELLVDGKPFWQAPKRVAILSPAEQDSEFIRGSRIDARSLTAMQLDNLVLLGKVWGFAKYHHPAVTGGKLNWDAELFRVLPAVLAATDRATATDALNKWLTKIGDPPLCAPCAQFPMDAQLMPAVEWTRDQQALGKPLSDRLQAMYRNRPAVGSQYYVSLHPNVGNPDFSNEAEYGFMAMPDAGYRLLALYRFWNIIEYWYPNRNIMEENWDGVLREFLPRLMNAADATSYRLALMQLSARIHDTHSNIWPAVSLRPPRGEAQLPVLVRFVENKAVVSGLTPTKSGPASVLQLGDVIERMEGAPVDSLVRAWRPYYSASNEPTRLRDIAGALTRGAAGPTRLTILRKGKPVDVTAERVPLKDLDLTRARVHDLPGETFQRLSDEVAYLKLSSVKMADAAEYIRRAGNAKVLVIDIRNYPSDFVVFALGSHLVTATTPFVRFTHADLSNPGLFTWTEPLSLIPGEPRFNGKIVILVDETTQSSAEYTSMAFRSAPNSMVVGSTTAGADGNVSQIPLPGGAPSMISGIGVFYPNRAPTQRVGIKPDLVVQPTIEGIRAGRDEVLEAGVSRALGHQFRLPTAKTINVSPQRN